MDVKESYRTLELAIGASRAEVEAAYLRLIERWHPGRAASGGPAAVSEAQRMVQAINDAYNTLIVIAPTTAAPVAPLPTTAAPPAPVRSKSSAPPDTTSAPPPTGAKPKLAPLSTAQPDLGRPPPPKPPTGAWEARTSSPPGSPPPPAASAPLPPPAAPAAPAPAPVPAPAPAPPPAASAPPPAPTPKPAKSSSKRRAVEPEEPSAFRTIMGTLYDKLFPVDSPRRKYGHVIIGAALIFLFFVGKCACSSKSGRHDREPDPKTTARLVVKSNLEGASVEAKFIAPPGDATVASFSGTAGQALAGLPPGKYAVTARSEGWPDIHGEVSVDAGHATEIALNFKGGSLRLDSDPTGAEVRQGETVFGKTPLVIPQLPPGECQLSVVYGAWPPVSFKTTITAGEEAAGTVRLPHGKLTVETSPPGASVLLAGHPLGQTPLTVEHFPAGVRKLTVQAKDFPPLQFSVGVEDGADVKVHPALGSAYPELDPAELLRYVWVPDDPKNIAPPFDGLTGPSKPQNGVIKNLNRKRLYEGWLFKTYSFTAVIKAYDKPSGQIEFVEQQSDLSKYHVVATLSAAAHNDPTVTAQLVKGATFGFYGRLNAVEEARWSSKGISFEFTVAEPLR